jgi:hypothetical protein
MFALAPDGGVTIGRTAFVPTETFELLEIPGVERPYCPIETRSADLTELLTGQAGVLWRKSSASEDLPPQGTRFVVKVSFDGGTLEFDAIAAGLVAELRWGNDGDRLDFDIPADATISWIASPPLRSA